MRIIPCSIGQWTTCPHMASVRQLAPPPPPPTHTYPKTGENHTLFHGPVNHLPPQGKSFLHFFSVRGLVAGLHLPVSEAQWTSRVWTPSPQSLEHWKIEINNLGTPNTQTEMRHLLQRDTEKKFRKKDMWNYRMSKLSLKCIFWKETAEIYFIVK